MRFDFKISANFCQQFCCFVFHFIMPHSWEAYSRARQAILNRENFSVNTVRRNIFRPSLYRKHSASRNATFFRQKPCSANGNVVRPYNAPLQKASSRVWSTDKQLATQHRLFFRPAFRSLSVVQ